MNRCFLISGLSALGLVSTAALAADLPGRKLPPAPVMVSAPQFDWSGFYVGGYGGAGWAKSRGDTTVSSPLLALFPAILPTINSAGSNDINIGGGLAGVTAGYSLAVDSSVVVGVEGDIGWAGLSGAVTTSGMVPVFNGAFGFNQKAQADWMATLRGRLGVTLLDNLLVYGTGGLAATSVRYSSDFSDVFNEYEFFRLRSARLGWTLGAGVEFAFNQNWSAKLEYLHAGFGGTSGLGSTTLTDGSTAWVQHNFRSFGVDMIRAGVNYRFGGGHSAPVMAKY
jgi:outer membrane immunogenic protein